MKYKVERCLECARSWVVLNPQGHVVYETNIWQWAVDYALVRYCLELERGVKGRMVEA